MATQKLQTLSMPDRAVIEAFSDIARRFDAESASIAAQPLEGNVSAMSGRWNELEKNAGVQEILKLDAAAFNSLTLQLPSLSGHVSVVRQKEGLDEISLYIRDGAPSEQAAQFVGSVRKAFRAYDRAAAIEQRLGPELTDFYRRREASVLRLEETTQRLIEQNTAYRAELDTQLAARRVEQDTELAARRARLQEEFEARERELADARAKLAQREAAINDRTSTHERRRLREQLKEIIAARNTNFALTPATRAKRWPTMILFVILALTTGAFTILSAWHALTDPSLLLAVRLLLSGVSFLTTMAFFIRWNDRWAQIHAEEEFRLKRLELDIDRASWVVEMALEWKEERGSAIPPELLDRLTRNLFTDNGTGDLEVRHPTQDLVASLLGASASARLALPGGEISLDRKGLQKLNDDGKLA